MPGAVPQQRAEVAVVGPELPIVKGLVVVGVGAGGQQQLRQLHRLRMRWFVPFAAAERAGQRGERRGQPLPEESAVRIGAGVQEHPKRADGLADAQPGIAEVEQWRPAVRSVLPGDRTGIDAEPLGELVGPAAGRERGGRAGGQRRIRGQQVGGPIGGGRLGIAQAGQPQEPVGVIIGFLDRFHRSRQVGPDLDVLDQLRPAGESVRPGQHPLRPGQRDRATPGVEGGDQLDGVGVVRGGATPDLLGPLAQSFPVRSVRQGPPGRGVVGQVRIHGSSFAGPDVRAVGAKEVRPTRCAAQVGSALPADRWRPAAPSATVPSPPAAAFRRGRRIRASGARPVRAGTSSARC